MMKNKIKKSNWKKIKWLSFENVFGKKVAIVAGSGKVVQKFKLSNWLVYVSYPSPLSAKQTNSPAANGGPTRKALSTLRRIFS